MLVFEGTLPVIFKLDSKSKNDLEYKGHPSRFVHCPDEDESDIFIREKNDFSGHE